MTSTMATGAVRVGPAHARVSRKGGHARCSRFRFPRCHPRARRGVRRRPRAEDHHDGSACRVRSVRPRSKPARTTARRSRDSRVASSGPARHPLVVSHPPLTALPTRAKLTISPPLPAAAPPPLPRPAPHRERRRARLRLRSCHHRRRRRRPRRRAPRCGVRHEDAIIEGGDNSGTCVNRGCVPPKRSSPPPAAFAT